MTDFGIHDAYQQHLEQRRATQETADAERLQLQAIERGLADCRQDLGIPEDAADIGPLVEVCREARRLSVLQSLVLGVFLAAHAEAAVEAARETEA